VKKQQPGAYVDTNDGMKALLAQRTRVFAFRPLFRAREAKHVRTRIQQTLTEKKKNNNSQSRQQPLLRFTAPLTCSITRSKHTAHELASSGFTPLGTAAARDAVEAVDASSPLLLLLLLSLSSSLSILITACSFGTAAASAKARFVPDTFVEVVEDETPAPIDASALPWLDSCARDEARVGGRFIVVVGVS
jgi:hypothetical protein